MAESALDWWAVQVPLDTWKQSAASSGAVVLKKNLAADGNNPSVDLVVMACQADLLIQFSEFEHCHSPLEH